MDKETQIVKLQNDVPLSINNLSNSNVTIHIATWFESYMTSTEY